MANIDGNSLKKKFLVVDGNGLAYRSFYAVPVYKSVLGLPLNAICGFVKLLFNVIRTEAPSHVLVAFDHNAFSEHMSKYQAYNVKRLEMPDDLAVQLHIIEDFVHACGLPTCCMSGFEADDCIGTMVRKAGEAGFNSLIVAGDLDLLQLVTSDVRVLTTQRGLGDTVVYNESSVLATLKLRPRQLADMRALAGDSSQNIGGIPGIGNVTAGRLLAQYDSLENLYDNLERLPAKWRNPLREYRDLAWECRSRAAIRTDLPIPLEIEDCQFTGIPVQKLSRIFKLLGSDFEFGEAMLDSLQGLAGEEMPSLLPKECLYGDEARSALDKCAHGSGDVALIWLNHRGEERGIAVAVANEPVVYVACGNDERELSSAEVWHALEPLFADSSRVKYIYRGFDVSYRHSVVCHRTVDVAWASALLYPELWDHSLEDICNRFGLVIYDRRLLFGVEPIDWDNIPIQNKLCWAGCAATVLVTLGPLIMQELRRRGLWEMFRSVDMPLGQALNELIVTGISFDCSAVEQMRSLIVARMGELRQDIWAKSGMRFNLDDDGELGEFLFGTLSLLVPTRPKPGESIGADMLEFLESQHPLVADIRKYRELADFLEIFVKRFFVERNMDFDIKGGLFNVAVMAERRLQLLNKAAMAGPALILHRLSTVVCNLLCRELRSPLFDAVRRTVVPTAPQRCIAAFKYEYAPWLVLAHLAHDVALSEACSAGNVEKELATYVFELAPEEVKSDHLYAMGLMAYHYMSPVWMARQLAVSPEEAALRLKRFDDVMAERFPDSVRFLQAELAKVKAMQPVQTLGGRSRLHIESGSRIYDIRECAQRYAMIYAVEGTVADILRVAISEVRKQYGESVNILPFADGFIVDMAVDGAEQTAAGLLEIFSNCTFGIRIPISWKIGRTWYEVG